MSCTKSAKTYVEHGLTVKEYDSVQIDPPRIFKLYYSEGFQLIRCDVYERYILIISISFDNNEKLKEMSIPTSGELFTFDKDNGERFEGYVMENGYILQGNKFSFEGFLTFTGTTVMDVKFGFGKEYYPDNLNYPRYVGFYKNGLWDGLGIEYSRDGSVFRSGDWKEGIYLDASLTLATANDLKYLSNYILHLHVQIKTLPNCPCLKLTECKRLVTLDFCDFSCADISTFDVSGLTFLQAIVIGQGCFSLSIQQITQMKGKLSSLSLSHLPSLETVEIADACLNHIHECIVTDCAKLTKLVLGSIKYSDEYRNEGCFQDCKFLHLSRKNSSLLPLQVYLNSKSFPLVRLPLDRLILSSWRVKALSCFHLDILSLSTITIGDHGLQCNNGRVYFRNLTSLSSLVLNASALLYCKSIVFWGILMFFL